MSDFNDPQKVTYLGQVDYRNKSLTFGIKAQDRTRHMYVIGKTGMGKSTLLENLAIQDIRNGEGVCVIDPHGSMAEKLLEYIPKDRMKDVIYFAPFDTEFPLGLNVLEKVESSKRHLVANGLMSAFKKIFGEERFSDRIQYILNNIILALLENENESLLGVNRMLIDKEYRKFIVSNVKDPSVRSFWLEEFVKAGDKYQQEAAPGIQNKIGQFISNPLIRNIIGQQRTAFDIREIMDKQKILIVNLSKGKVGEGNANLIGSLLITKIYLAAMSRADAGVHELEKLPPFYFYVDEFQNFANESFANILSEARKYNLALTVAHQYIEQMTDEVKAAVFGNVGSMIAFRVGATDAEVFEKEFAPFFTADDIVNLSAYQIYLRLMIDGVGSRPFSAKTLGQFKKPDISFVSEIIEYSRTHYAKRMNDAEEEIRTWYEPKLLIRQEESKKETTVVSQQVGYVTQAKKEERNNERASSSANIQTKDFRTRNTQQLSTTQRRDSNGYSKSENIKNSDTLKVVPEIKTVQETVPAPLKEEVANSHVSTLKTSESVTYFEDEKKGEKNNHHTLPLSQKPESNYFSQSERERKDRSSLQGEKMTSLKEALMRAMQENEQKQVKTSKEKEAATLHDSLIVKDEKKEVKEIDEAVLISLVKDKELDTLLSEDEK